MDLTVLNLAVPQLSTDLAPSSAQLLWIVDIYGFLVAGLLVTMGTLGDRIGRRLLLLGAAAFSAASVLAAYSTSAGITTKRPRRGGNWQARLEEQSATTSGKECHHAHRIDQCLRRRPGQGRAVLH